MKNQIASKVNILVNIYLIITIIVGVIVIFMPMKTVLP